jgi:hypothetical protein
MADSPIESTINKWRERATQAQGLGIPLSSYQELAKRDVQNVRQGGVGMTDTEFALGVLAGQGRPVVQVERGTRAQDVPGNVPKDIEDIVRGFIPGAIKYVTKLPGEIASLFTDEDRGERLGFEDSDLSLSGLAAAARNVAKDPIFSILPGVFALSQATTEEGRQELAKHPVMTLLDVLPFAGAVGKGATAGKIAKPGGAVEALQQGRPTRAAFRATTDVVGRAPVIGKPFRRQEWNALADQLGISSLYREKLSRPFTQTQRIAEKEAKSFIDREIMPVFGQMDEATRQAFTEYGIKRKTGEVPPNPEFDAINSQVNIIQERLANIGEEEGGLRKIYLPGVENPVVYSTSSPVVRNLQRVTRTEEYVGNVTNKLVNARAVQEKWTANLDQRAGKVRRFMESDEDFAARPIGEVSPAILRDAMRPFVESFQYLEPMRVFSEYLSKIYDGKVRAQTAGFLRRDFNKLKGETGLIAKLDEALSSDDVKSAAKYATQINNVLKHKAWDDFDTTTSLRRHIADVREELVGLRKRTKSFGYAARMAKKADDRVRMYEQRLQTAQSKLNDRRATYFDSLEKNPPRNFSPLLIDLIRSKATDAARELYHGTELEQVITRIQNTPIAKEIAELIGPDAFKEMWDGTIRSWMDLAREGYDPIWLHHVPPARYERLLKPQILPDQEVKPGQWKDAVLNFGPGISDVAVGLSAAASELIARKFTHEFISTHVMPFAKPKTAVHADITNALLDEAARNQARIRPSFGIRGEVDRIMQKEWADFDPNDFGMRMPQATKGELMVPKGVARSLKAFAGGYGSERMIPLRGVYDKTMKVYKYSVLIGPKQFSDVVFGGMLTVLLREPGAVTKLPTAIKMWKEGRLPEEFIHEFYDLNPDKLWNFKAGQTMARHFVSAVGGVPQALARMEEIVSAWQRTATYLSASERAAKKGGLPPALAREAGLRVAYKTLVDFDGMSWIERSIVRNVFPFYSFMRYVMQYALTYPTDHPIRAAILSRFSDMEMRDKKDGLAEKYQNYFWLGEPDENGNVKIVDYRSANPFQSLANNFTLAGFVSSINPLMTSFFEAAGLNTLTATPDLYPDMAYDPETGSLTAKRGNVLLTVAGNIIPQIEGVDYFLTITDKMKRLKERNPEAYKRQLYTHLHLPFAGAEAALGLSGLEINVPYERSKAELGRYRAAREELSQAIRNNDWSAVSRYNVVPFQGELVDPEAIESLWRMIAGVLDQTPLAGTNPRAVLPRG